MIRLLQLNELIYTFWKCVIFTIIVNLKGMENIVLIR